MKERVEMSVEAMDDTAEFLLHYQLEHDPFVPRPAGFRFFTPGRKPILAQLHHMAHFSEQMQVVLGRHGAGKTLLRQALVASCNKDKVQAVVTSARDYPDAAGLERFVCQTLGCQDTGALLERAEQLQATGMQLYLVLDDAHYLEQPALQWLAGLSQAGRAAPRVFLFAEEAIVTALEQVELPDDRAWLQLVELPALTPEEVSGYLAQRLEAAGQGIELLDEEQLARIYQLSDGWPGAVNRAARQVMLEKVAGPAPLMRRQRPALPIRSLVALVLVGAGVAIAWMMGGDKPEVTRTVLHLPERVTTLDVSAASSGAVLQMPGESSASAALEQPGAEPAGEVQPLADEVLPVPVAELEVSLPEPVILAEARRPDAAPLVAAPVPVAPPVPVVEPVAMAEPPRVVPPARRTEPALATPAAAAGYHQHAWYQQRAAGDYVLQLLGTRSRQAALDFIEAQSGLVDIGLFETLHEGKPWFVVTQGVYSSRSQATQGAARLPASLQRQNPWPRSIGSIQPILR